MNDSYKDPYLDRVIDAMTRYVSDQFIESTYDKLPEGYRNQLREKTKDMLAFYGKLIADIATEDFKRRMESRKV